MTDGKRRVITRTDMVCAAILLVLAALPRLCCLNLAEFKLDEATHYQMAYRLTHGEWGWVGSTASVGFPKPPLFIYALALPISLSHDPRIVTAFLGILAALATGGFYLILRRFLGKPAAFGAALLFALNPQAILYGRKLFTADLLPPLCTLFLGAAVAFLESSPQRIGRSAVFTAFTFALLLLNTLSPVLLIPAVGLLFWQRRRDLKPLHYLGAALTFSLPFLPYLWQVAPLIPDVVASTGGSLTCWPPLLRWLWNLLYGAPWPSNRFSIAHIAAISAALLSLGGTAWLLSAACKRTSRAWAAFFVAWLGLTPLVAAIVPVEVKMHYLVVLYPLLFVVPGAGVELAFRRAGRLGWTALALLVMTAGWQARVWVSNLGDIARGIEGYGTPLGYWWSAAEQARAMAAEHDAAEVLLLVPGDQPWDEKAHILDALLSDTPHRVIDGCHAVLYPPHAAVLLIASEVEDAVAFSAPCTQSLGRTLEASPFGGTYRYRLWLPDGPAASACITGLQPTSVQWASGARLLGYGIAGRAEPGQTLHAILHWETTWGALSEDIHWFNHLLDREELKWGQFDHASWPSARWQPGDQVMTHFDITIDPEAGPGPYVLRVGQYAYPSIESIPIVDDAGLPASHAVDLPLSQ